MTDNIEYNSDASTQADESDVKSPKEQLELVKSSNKTTSENLKKSDASKSTDESDLTSSYYQATLSKPRK